MSVWYILAGLALSHAAALVAGGYLHYRFGETVRRIEDAFEGVFRSK